MTSTPEITEAVRFPANLFPDQYIHWMGKAGDPGAIRNIRAARITMANAYERGGLATSAARTSPRGVLRREIDRSGALHRGVSFYLATHPTNQGDRATARIADSEDYTGLPTFGLTGEGVSLDVKQEWKEKVQGGYTVREIGGLASTGRSGESGAREILRRLLTDTIGRKHILFSSMVLPTLRALDAVITDASIIRIGDPTVLDENEYRPRTVLQPVLIDADNILSNLIAKARDAKTTRVRSHLYNSCLYFADKLPGELVPQEVQDMQGALLGRTVLDMGQTA